MWCTTFIAAFQIFILIWFSLDLFKLAVQSKGRVSLHRPWSRADSELWFRQDHHSFPTSILLSKKKLPNYTIHIHTTLVSHCLSTSCLHGQQQLQNYSEKSHSKSLFNPSHPAGATESFHSYNRPIEVALQAGCVILPREGQSTHKIWRVHSCCSCCTVMSTGDPIVKHPTQFDSQISFTIVFWLLFFCSGSYWTTSLGTSLAGSNKLWFPSNLSQKHMCIF